jgi:hypothetical protein
MGVVLESESSESEGDLPKKVEKEEEVRRVAETPRWFVRLFVLVVFLRGAQTSF